MRRRALLGAVAAGSVPFGFAEARAEAQRRFLNIVLDGDLDGLTPLAQSWPDVARAIRVGLGVPIRWSNVGVAGRQMLQCLLSFRQAVAPLLDVGARANIVVLHAGAADILRGRDPARVYAALGDYADAAHMAGWKLIVVTTFPPGVPPDASGRLAAYNQRLRANAARADAVVDLARPNGLADLEAAGRFDPEGAGGRDALAEEADGEGLVPGDARPPLASLLIPALRRVGSTG